MGYNEKEPDNFCSRPEHDDSDEPENDRKLLALISDNLSPAIANEVMTCLERAAEYDHKHLERAKEALSRAVAALEQVKTERNALAKRLEFLSKLARRN